MTQYQWKRMRSQSRPYPRYLLALHSKIVWIYVSFSFISQSADFCISGVFKKSFIYSMVFEKLTDFFLWAFLKPTFPFLYNKVYEEEGMLQNEFAFTPVSGILKFGIIALIGLGNMKISFNFDYK